MLGRPRLVELGSVAGVDSAYEEQTVRIDVHAHFVNERFYDAIQTLPGIKIRQTEPGASELRFNNTSYAWRREAWFDPDHCLRDMDAKGIDMRVLSLTSPNVHPFETAMQIDLARRLNDDILAYAARRPDRYRATVALPLADVPAALAELDRVRGHEMFAGVAMGSSLNKVPLNHKSLEPVWARLDALRCPVIEHPVYPANTDGLDEYELPIRVGFMFETTVALTRMIYAGIFERYPNFPYVVAHTGAALLMLMERLDNGYRIFPDCRRDITRLPSTFMKQLYYDSCSYSVDAQMLAHRMVGADRLMFGTDYPYIAHGDPSHVTQLPISDADKAMILGGNAARVFGIT